MKLVQKVVKIITMLKHNYKTVERGFKQSNMPSVPSHLLIIQTKYGVCHRFNDKLTTE